MYFVFVEMEIGSNIIRGSERPSFVILGQSYDIWIKIIILMKGDKKLGMRRKQVSGLKNSVGENKHLSLLFLFAIAPLFTWALQCSQHTYSSIAWQNSFAMSLEERPWSQTFFLRQLLRCLCLFNIIKSKKMKMSMSSVL